MRRTSLQVVSPQGRTDRIQANKRHKIHYYTDTNIDGYVDIAMSQELHKKLDKIDQQIEDVGKLCDKKKKESYEEYKEMLNYERQLLNQGIKDAINELKEKLKEYHEKINFDYKGKFKEVNTQLNNCINSLDKDISYNSRLQCKLDELEEDNDFYQRQLENMRDMNYYLKFKLKMKQDEEKTQNDNEKEINSSKNIQSTNEGDENKVQIMNNNESSPLLITTTGNAYKQTKEYQDIKEHIEKDLKFKMDFIIKRIKKDISNTKKDNEKLKNTINDVSNKSNYEEDSKELPDIYNSSSNENYYSGNDSSTAFGSKSISSHGYMDKIMKKETMLRFLENEEVKKFIYKYLYEV